MTCWTGVDVIFSSYLVDSDVVAAAVLPCCQCVLGVLPFVAYPCTVALPRENEWVAVVGFAVGVVVAVLRC